MLYWIKCWENQNETLFGHRYQRLYPSLAVVDGDNNIIIDQRQVLEVKQGEKGLQQSEGLFQHLKNLPFCLLVTGGVGGTGGSYGGDAYPAMWKKLYAGICCGLSQAQALSSYTSTPLYLLSHQEGHIMAGLKVMD